MHRRVQWHYICYCEIQRHQDLPKQTRSLSAFIIRVHFTNVLSDLNITSEFSNLKVSDLKMTLKLDIDSEIDAKKAAQRHWRPRSSGITQDYLYHLSPICSEDGNLVQAGRERAARTGVPAFSLPPSSWVVLQMSGLFSQQVFLAEIHSASARWALCNQKWWVSPSFKITRIEPMRIWIRPIKLYTKISDTRFKLQSQSW